MGGDPLALESRRRLYTIIRGSPGLGAREAQRAAGLGWGETAYHLDRLLDAGLVHRERGAHQDGYFAAEVPAEDRSLLKFTRSRSARRLLIALLEAPGATFPELEASTGLSSGRISVHLGRMIGSGLVRAGRRGRWRTFAPVDRERALRLLVIYRNGIADEWLERLTETWSELFRA